MLGIRRAVGAPCRDWLTAARRALHQTHACNRTFASAVQHRAKGTKL